MQRDLHPHGCTCAACQQPHPTDRHAMAARFWRGAGMALLLFWAFPGRWLLAAIWAALSPLFTR